MKNPLYESHYSLRNLPKNISKSNLPVFFHEIKKFIPQSFFYLYKDIYLINQNLFSLTKFKMFSKFTHYPNNKRVDIFKLLIKNILKSNKQITEIEYGLWILDDKVNVYYHWLFDSLQRYFLLPEELQKHPIMIPEVYKNNFIIEHLDFLEINYLIIEKNKLTKVNNCIIPSYSAPSGNFNNEVLMKMRNSYLEKFNIEVTKNMKRKIWIDRHNVRRQIKNKEEILNILKKYNIEIIQPEKFKIKEIIKIISESQIIMGPHGSGLSNILFANKGTTIIDIREKTDNYRNAIFSLSSDLGLNYFFFNDTSVIDEDESVYLDKDILDKFLSNIL